LLDERFNRGFSYQYVAKIAEKVEREAHVRADRTQVEQHLNFTRENNRTMRDELLKIVYWSEGMAPEGDASLSCVTGSKPPRTSS
jgi:hypothetical protein